VNSEDNEGCNGLGMTKESADPAFIGKAEDNDKTEGSIPGSP